MANAKKRILALVMALTLITGQLAIPAAATEEETQNVEVSVDVAAVLPETPGAESQAPAASDSMTVTDSAPVTTTDHDSAAGIIEESTSTTTDWSGTDGDTAITGTETTTTVIGTDDYTGGTLYEGGSTAGSETTTTTVVTTDSVTEEDTVTKEIITTVESESIEGTGEGSHTGEETSKVDEGEWKDTEEGITEGEFKADEIEEWAEDPESTALGEESLPEGGITIGLTEGPENTYTGTVNGEIIPLEEGVTIPDGAVLVKDDDGNVIGYTLSTTTERINKTTTTEGDAEKDEENSSTDTSGTTAAVTPDLEAAAQNLGIRIDEDSKIDEETDENGNVTAYVVTNTTVTEGEMDAYGELARPEAGVKTLEDGTVVTTTVEDVLDADGKVIGFKSTEVKTDADGNELGSSVLTQIINEPELPKAAEPVVTYTLPERPAESTVTGEDGVTTAVTVSEILDENGDVIGYKSTTVKTDANGAELFRGEEDIYGTETTVTETITTGNPGMESTGTYKTTVVETTRVTAEESTFNDLAAYTRLNEIVNDMTVDTSNEVVMIDGKLYYIYTGSVTVSEGAEHGDVSLMNPITPMSSLMNGNDAQDLSGYGGNNVVDDTGKPDDGFKYIGYGIYSTLSIGKGKNDSSSVTQFRLKSEDGKTYYALCIDFNTTIEKGHMYDIADITSEDYYQTEGSVSTETADKLRSIALNGYWGTESGVGSMSSFKAFLREEMIAAEKAKLNVETLTEKQLKAIDNFLAGITHGQALAATQAALWKFGNYDSNAKVNENRLVANREKDSTDYQNVESIYDILLAEAEAPTFADNEGVEFLDAEDITATSIVVKDKVASAEETGKNVYNTDLNFTLGIEPTKLIGDLKVTVYDSNNKPIKSVVLASTDALIPIGLKPDANGIYTISDIEIAEGVTVNLKLDGTQDLGTGVYIYTSLEGSFNDSQTLITLATGKRKVDLDIAMTLGVQEPTVTREASGETQHGTRTDTVRQTKTDYVTRSSTTTKSKWNKTAEQIEETNVTLTTDVTLTEVTTEETVIEKSWLFSWLKEFAPEGEFYDGDGGYGDYDGGNDGYIILDEEVPLADAPKTGDISHLWAAMSLISLGGAVLMNRKKEEE